MSAVRRAFASVGALGCGASVALGAYAMHGLQGAASQRAGLAALFAFGHGLVLLLAAPAASRLRVSGLGLIAVGVVLFAGSLAAAALAGTATTFAPAGGMLLMLGWIVLAVDALRG